MRRQRQPRRALAAGVILLTIGAFFLFEQEPKYSGRSLSEWERIYVHHAAGPLQSDEAPACREAIEAIREAREQAIPWALQLISTDKPAWKNRTEGLIERCHGRRWLPKGLWLPFYGDPANKGMFVFKMLGSDGAPAIPRLLEVIKDSKSVTVADRAFDALAYIGKESISPLVRLLSSSQNTYRFLAVRTISMIEERTRDAAISAASVLIECINDTDDLVACTAIAIVSGLSLPTESVIPALTKALTSPSEKTRRYAAESLKNFETSVPVLRQDLNEF